MSGFERWIDKVAIVTGASSGIGADVAKQLVHKGLKVVGLARRIENIEKLAKDLSSAPGKLYAVKCDLSKEEDILNAFQWTSKNVGPVHILINNAGVNRGTNLIEGDTERWRTNFKVNVIGLLIATREAVKIMRENKIDGHIINVNSVLGHCHAYFPIINVYAATKHAVKNLTETLRQEFNANSLKIKITSVSPGVVKTEFAQAAGVEIPVEMLKMPALEADDVSDAILYALSTKPHVQIHEITLRPIGQIN